MGRKARNTSAPGERKPALDGGAWVHQELAALAVAVADLRPYGRNPRRGDVEAIKRSLVANGQYRPLVVNRRSAEVLAGNHTLRAAKELGWSEVAATFVDVDEDQAKRIALVDNRTNDLAGYDDAALAELLGALPDLEGTGFDDASLSRLLDEVQPIELPGADEDVPSRPAKPRTRPGDLYRLGAHRLLCGDATSASDYRRLLGAERPQLLWTDPPYGVSYEGKTAQRLRIAGDRAEGLKQLLGAAFACCDAVLAEGAALYVAHPAGPGSLVFGGCFEAQGWRLRQTLVWVKDSLVLGRSDYHYRHEPILYGYKPAGGRLGRGGSGWYGGNGEQSVFEFSRPKASRHHPTMKPPELVAAALNNSSCRGQQVLDPFAGSGSTLVACQASAREARLIELDPAYCDVIVERFESLTGVKAEKTGR
ncbi:MAG: ParB N-terminal domain-containing protein [Actinobacteria bacterium]|nr:ParB N-terminal domain-containing protein [Actinomycetota bacterium]